tara:strand:- start:50881 stop:51384 length:504 start_codon:yes stop_codon:yes gene_type:complete
MSSRLDENPADPVLIVVPILLSWTTSYFFGRSDPYKYTPAWFQPPGWVFGIVWTLLYVMLGFLLYESKREKEYGVLSLVVVLLFFTYLWQYLFNYKKWYRLAVYDLLLVLVISLILYVLLNYSAVVDKTSFGQGYLMVYIPFIAWIIFAIIMSVHTGYPKKAKIRTI